MIIWTDLALSFKNSIYLSKISTMYSLFGSHLVKQKIVKWSFLLVILMLLPTSLPANSETKETRHILILNSYHQDMTWVNSITQAVTDVLVSDKFDYIFHIENMDSKRHYDEKYFDALFNLYAEKYKKISFDLILSSDNNAFDFLKKYNRLLFPKVPIVFSGINYFKPSQIVEYPEFTGVTEFFSDVDTIKTILKFHPEVEEIFIINDFTPSGKAWTKTMVDNFYAAELDKQVRISFSGNLPIKSLQRQLEQLGDDVIVLLGVYFKDKNGSYLTFEKIQKELLMSTNRPIYALLNFNVAENVIGGKVISGYSQGAIAAKLGLQVLKGKAPIDIPVVEEGINPYVFNWPQLKRWNIDLNLLPEGSKIINRPLSFYEQNSMVVWGTLSLITFLVFALLLQARISYFWKVTNRKLEQIVYERTIDLSLQSKMLEDISHLSTTGGWKLDIPTMHLVWSKETYHIFDLPETFEPTFDEVISFFSEESKPVLMKAIEKAIDEGIPYELELSAVTAKGRFIWVRALCEVVHHNERRQALIGAIQDVTERKKTDDKILHLAMTDSLTGLANRTQFKSQFNRSIKLAERENKYLALMMIDLDKFKPVNDTFGHQTGDELLQAVASVFTDNARESDIVARLGGDEFAILVVHPDKDESVAIYARRVINELTKTFNISGNKINIGASIGIARYPQDSIVQDELLKKADIALYKAKENGGSKYIFYHPDMD